MTIEIRELPAFRVAYVRRHGEYGPGIGECFGKLMTWAGSQGLCGESTMVLAAYWDDPQSTPPQECRSDACITIPDDVAPAADSGVQVQTLPGGLCALHLCSAEQTEQIGALWHRIWTDWLPLSGYACDHRPCYEIYYNCGESHPLKRWIMDFVVPVRQA